MTRIDTSKLKLGEIVLLDARNAKWRWNGSNFVILSVKDIGNVKKGQRITFGPYELEVQQEEHNGWLCKRI